MSEAEPKIVYTPRSDATPQTEMAALAALYKFCLESHAKKEATRPGSPDDAKEIKNVSRHKHHSR